MRGYDDWNPPARPLSALLSGAREPLRRPWSRDLAMAAFGALVGWGAGAAVWLMVGG